MDTEKKIGNLNSVNLCLSVVNKYSGDNLVLISWFVFICGYVWI